MEINQIVYFLKLADTCNFSKAADLLYITQPSLSQQIAKLEKELNVALIDRTTRSFELTKAGIEFETYAKKVIDDFHNLEDVMTKYRTEDKHCLKIGIFPTLSKIGLTKYIFAFNNIHPKIKIELFEDFSELLYSMAITKKVDLAIANKIDYPFHNAHVKLSYSPIISDRIVLLCGKNHPLASKKTVTLEESLTYPLIKLSAHSSIAKIMSAQFLKRNLTPTTACECKNTSNLISIVDEDYGVSFLSSTVASHYATENTRLIDVVPKIPHSTVIITRKENADTPLISSFIDFLTTQSYPLFHKKNDF